MSEEEESAQERRKLYQLVDRRIAVDTSIKARDPIQQLLDDEENEMIKEVRRARLQALLKKYKKEAGLNGEETDGKAEDKEMQQVISPQLITELAKLPDDQREKAIDIYQRLMIAQKTNTNDVALSLAIGAVKGNPSGSRTEVQDFASALAQMFQTGVTVTKEAAKNVDPLELVRTTAEIIERAHPQQEGQQQQQQQQSNPLYDALSLLDEFEKRGWLSKKSEGQPPVNPIELKKIDLEIEKLRMERDISLKKLEMEINNEKRKMDIEERRIDSLMQGVERVAKAAGTALAEGEEEIARKSGLVPASEPPSAGNVKTFRCEVCNSDIIVPEPDKPREIKCPKCESVYDYKPS